MRVISLPLSRRYAPSLSPLYRLPERSEIRDGAAGKDLLHTVHKKLLFLEVTYK